MSSRVVGRGGTYRLLYSHVSHARDAATRDARKIVPLRGDPVAAAAFVRALAASAGSFAAVRALLSSELGTVHGLDDAEVERALAHRLASGRMIAERLDPISLFAHDGSPEEVEPPPGPTVAPTTPRTWIEIELVDTEGNPIPDELYWIQLPDGSVREGRLNGGGRAYFGDLDPGECDIRWPNLDGEAFAPLGEPAVPRKRVPPPKREVVKKTWVEIELVGMDGSPIPHEKYQIKLPDGETVEGELDELGFARFEELESGTCSVCFPALDKEAWESV